MLDPAKHAPSNPVRLKVVLDAGVPLARVDSPYHAITQRDADGGRVIELAEGEVPANKDFELTWTPAAGHAPQAALFTEKRGDRHYALLMVMPPAKEVAAARLPREVIFVIDTSGSMSGSSIAQAQVTPSNSPSPASPNRTASTSSNSTPMPRRFTPTRARPMPPTARMPSASCVDCNRRAAPRWRWR